ncbi:MAG: hypothetical protein IJZ95_07305 [Oscillospiraceae bacterium]|nr:hypothetical protein [Oscillospiraceae bacterium]
MNTIEYAKIFQQELDKQIVQASTTGWMEDNTGQVIYNGGNEIKIPDLVMQGLANYSREEGFAKGSVTFKFQTYALTMDRGRRFRLDAMDVDESNFGVTAARVASEFQRTKVIPEIDAYRYSKLSAAAAISSTYTPAASTILSKLYEDINAVRDEVGDVDLVISISRKIYGMLSMSDKISRQLVLSQFKQGDIDMAIKTLDNIPLIPVPSARMKSEYIFTADGEGGYTPAEGAKQINWIVCPRRSPIAISKTDNIKIITPELNQQADAWDIPYRKYHDIIIPDNQKAAIAVSFAG